VSCAAPEGGASTSGVNLAREAVVEGVVLRSGQPVHGAYVRLLDAGGEFTAEVTTSESGGFRLFTRPATWTLRVLAPGSAVAEATVEARQGETASVQIALPTAG